VECQILIAVSHIRHGIRAWLSAFCPDRIEQAQWYARELTRNMAAIRTKFVDGLVVQIVGATH
jgi:hypothetical protein